MGMGRFIVNKSALKRIFFIYLPVLLAGYVALVVAGITTTRHPPPLDLSQSFKGKMPIVYSDDYNITFYGLEKLHRFDSAKYGKIVAALEAAGAVDRQKLIAAAPPSRELLELAHGRDYLDSLESPFTLAKILELPPVRLLPSRLAHNVILEPMLYQAGGSLLAARVALQKGWAINLGGGFHHASRDNGEGFCPIADISLVIKYLRREKLAQKFMIVDLDAHQGNGHETDFGDDADVYILDIYNKDVFPHDEAAKQGIDMQVELDSFTGDAEYLAKTGKALDAALDAFKPDMIIYNAGTDILAGDPLGGLDVSAKAVSKRDEMVFRRARRDGIPIVMLLSGGYQQTNAATIADSLLNLRAQMGLF